jgi:hypothetical protein
MNTPILLLVFNRLEPVKQMVESLKIIKPTKIYIASDGPRNNHKVDTLLVHEVREYLLKNINWSCEVETRFLDRNNGCKLAVSSAIQWFFSQVNEGIVLEDDCIPNNLFFDFVEEMLITHKSNKDVATISGRNEYAEYKSKDAIFSSKFFCWGWASWSDRIIGIDVEFGYQKHLPKVILNDLGFLEKQHVKGIYNLMSCKVVNSWAYSYDLYFRMRGKVHLISNYNYISNVGIGAGTHNTKAKTDNIFFSDSTSNHRVSEVFKPNKDYLSGYLRKKYSFLKIILFPYIGYLKRIKLGFK